MNNIVNVISDSVLNRAFSDCSVDEIRQLVEQNPYSAALQLLYAEKLRSEGSQAFGAQWSKALLYFDNPLFVQSVVQSGGTDNLPVNKALLPADQEESKSIDSNTEVISETETRPSYHDDNKDVEIPKLKIEAIDPESAVLSFTPYHTIDYFASQGIKIGADLKSTDKFGTQLKTFTSWLREMRRLPEADVVSKFSQHENNKIEKMAEASLTGENAITEAMAQVWIKQGNLKKAIDIYKKLSLQNPPKSAFFAAKIDHLKKQL